MTTKDTPEIPMRHLNHYTVIHDMKESRVLQRINGVVALPAGAIVELEGKISAEVVRVRLLIDGTKNATVCLDVKVLA